MNVDELAAYRHRLEGILGEDLLEAVIVLDELRQDTLQERHPITIQCTLIQLINPFTG